MGQFVEGEWLTEKQWANESGKFERQATTFRGQVRADGSTSFTPDAGRYHLYVSLACPWAHRTLIVRKLLGLEDAISLSVVDPLMTEDGWHFSDGPGCIPDSVNDAQFLREIYLKADQNYTGRVTVPVLWDKKTGTIVNNESREVICMFNTQFTEIATKQPNLCPDDLVSEIDSAMDEFYEPVNNGVYKSGFATTQEAYEEAVKTLFKQLDKWDAHLANQRYICGSQFTEADICMFTTLVRFDPVYVGHFKCNIRRIADYEHLSGYLRDIYQTDGIVDTVDFDHIKGHYYRSHKSVNPTGIVPVGPAQNLLETHGRDKL